MTCRASKYIAFSITVKGPLIFIEQIARKACKQRWAGTAMRGGKSSVS